VLLAGSCSSAGALIWWMRAGGKIRRALILINKMNHSTWTHPGMIAGAH